MKGLNEYINEYNTSTQIQPNFNHEIFDVRPTSDKQSITSDKDKIYVEFTYYGEKVTHFIKYKDINKRATETQWSATFKSKKHMNIKYKVMADRVETGRFGITIINMKVHVLINGHEDTVVVPKCAIQSNQNFNNSDMYIDANNI